MITRRQALQLLLASPALKLTPVEAPARFLMPATLTAARTITLNPGSWTITDVLLDGTLVRGAMVFAYDPITRNNK